jgi:hypothetical protein
MTVNEVLALPVAFDLRTAGRAFGFGETKTRELVRSGEFPLKPLRLGNAYRFRRADLLAVLGIEEDQEQAAGGDAA